MLALTSRVDQMFTAGWVAEVRQLLETYPVLGRTASQAVGYREILEYLQRNQRSASNESNSSKRRTRQFARRQDTWFRSLSECRHIDPAVAPDPAALAEQILETGDWKPETARPVRTVSAVWGSWQGEMANWLGRV